MSTVRVHVHKATTFWATEHCQIMHLPPKSQVEGVSHVCTVRNKAKVREKVFRSSLQSSNRKQQEQQQTTIRSRDSLQTMDEFDSLTDVCCHSDYAHKGHI